LCLLIGGAAVGYVWQKNQIDQLGRQIKQRETKLAELRDQNKKLRDQMAMLRSPARLQQKMLELNLGLVAPRRAMCGGWLSRWFATGGGTRPRAFAASWPAR
jgi:hypothetical protein